MERMEKLSSMERDFVKYTEALELKELGFDEPCVIIYYNDGKNYVISETLMTNNELNTHNEITSPFYQQAFRWFREKYELEGITQQAEDFAWYKWKISQYNEDGKKYVADWYEYETYEEAELTCLKKLIEIVKEKL